MYYLLSLSLLLLQSNLHKKYLQRFREAQCSWTIFLRHYWIPLFQIGSGGGDPRSPLRCCVQHGKYVKSRYVVRTPLVAKSIKRWELNRKSSFLSFVSDGDIREAPARWPRRPAALKKFFWDLLKAYFKQRRPFIWGNLTVPCLSRCHFVSGSSWLMRPRTVLSLSAGESGSFSCRRSLHFFSPDATLVIFCYRHRSWIVRRHSYCCFWAKCPPFLCKMLHFLVVTHLSVQLA